MKAATLNIRIEPESRKELERLARQWGRSPNETGARLLEEELRRRAFRHIEFRSTPAGRHAFITGTRLAVWQVAGLLERRGGSLEKTARYLRCPKEQIRAAQLYAKAYPAEIQTMLRENKAATFESLSCLLPSLEKLAV
jgi:uncharacterized protein (DUF433 family)